MVPLYQFPNIAAWRTDKLDGPIDADAANYQAFQNINEWTANVRRSDHHRCRAVARLREPDHPVRQLVLDRLDHDHEGPDRTPTTPPATATYEVTPLLTGEPKVQVLN